ncbi:CpaF family protein [Blautia pseudococcoides]|uniref:Pilus assembly protein n=1 Tax=Blautia pseudococcoides TaxID=1796616 RepID=A0A1C7IEL1_9FIRM|nr:ATPase, T2SS/T4P/T4SS family [Blautia pseudococcoides]ANU78091.1 pilus assembly protein [Blautia pseudococcoides]ASU30899.1 pilus assembly protein [Blautia pseudococcoides]QQQ91429.1 CpaF family protein [Blautia pseudococcoides]
MEVFSELRNSLMERLDSMWESTDEEVMELIDRLLMAEGRRLGLNLGQKSALRRELFSSIRKLDVLQELLEDSCVTEIMVNGWQHIFVEREGRISLWEKHFTSPEKLDDVIQQIAGKCNRVINTLHPIVDARLENGSRVNAVIAPAALNGPILTIRQFPKEPVTIERLLSLGSVTEEALGLLLPLVRAKYTILIGGGTGAGKTTMLNALSEFIPEDERIITIEDNAELQIQGIPNLVRLECRAANIEESQEITMSDLLKTALRMRPDRIIVGEVRSDAEELLQAVNVGAEGSMSTIHANSCNDMISRLETMVLMGINLPLPAVRRQIAAGFDIFVHLGRLRDKTRRILEICEIDGMADGEILLNPLFLYEEERGLVQKGKLRHREKLEKAGMTLEDGL